MWERELKVAAEAAKESGDLLRWMFGQVSHVEKKGRVDLVTEADLRAQETIVGRIRKTFPQDGILAEEKGAESNSSYRTWIIDPLDGTTNFVHSFPFFAVSIALEIRGEIVLGVVYNPYMEEYFEGVKGGGSSMNGKTIEVSETPDIGEALLATGFPYDIHEAPGPVLELFGKMLVASQGLRRPGSAAIDLCYVAAGRLDGFWEKGLKPWDTAAGILIVEEAGGKLSTFEGRPYTPYERSIVAANAYIHGAMVDIISK